jgi:hypothetical protein
MGSIDLIDGIYCDHILPLVNNNGEGSGHCRIGKVKSNLLACDFAVRISKIPSIDFHEQAQKGDVI